jgi:hypothetical protein
MGLEGIHLIDQRMEVTVMSHPLAGPGRLT